MRTWLVKCCLYAGGALLASTALLAGITALSLKTVSTSLHKITSDAQSVRVTDRHGVPLGISYKSQWNTFDSVPLYEIPEFLQSAFLYSEDRQFFNHGGVNWPARFYALTQNLRRGETVRGASTITEQVVRMINPRPRTIWSRWLEGIEAALLEDQTKKFDILEFYLNQIPYAANRRGVSQGARYYFNRDLSTLSPHEMLALAVLVRAPSAYDPYRHPGKIDAPLLRLADALHKSGKIDAATFADIQAGKIYTEKPSLPVEARHFAREVRLRAGQHDIYRTTLDSSLQQSAQALLDRRLQRLSGQHVTNAGLLIADHSKQYDYECIDGKQRMTTILNFFKPDQSEESPLTVEVTGKNYTYSELKSKHPTIAKNIENYELSFTIYKAFHDDGEFVRQIFRRLQLGVRLNSGELLKTRTGTIKDFIYKEIGNKGPFFRNSNLSIKRFSILFTLAQICINSFSKANTGEYTRARYDDLSEFFEENASLDKSMTITTTFQPIN